MAVESRFDWERIVRRCRLSPTTKLVALTVATYASGDGTSAFPGNERLRLTTGLSDKSVRTALATLRDAGLLLRTYEGSRARGGTRGRADEYELVIPADLPSRLHLLNPGESWESEECDDDCEHPITPVTRTGGQGSQSADHRQLTPRPPVNGSRPPVNGSTDTGNPYRPPVHDQPCTSSSHQRGQQSENRLTAGRRGEDKPGLINGWMQTDEPTATDWCNRHPIEPQPCRTCLHQSEADLFGVRRT